MRYQRYFEKNGTFNLSTRNISFFPENCNMHFVYKYSFENMEELQQAVPKLDYTDVGHYVFEDPYPVAWMYDENEKKFIFGSSHSDIIKKELIPIYGNDSFVFMTNSWTGRFDFSENIISVSCASNIKPDPPPELLEKLKREFEKIIHYPPVGIVSFIESPHVLAGSMPEDIIIKIEGQEEFLKTVLDYKVAGLGDVFNKLKNNWGYALPIATAFGLWTAMGYSPQEFEPAVVQNNLPKPFVAVVQEQSTQPQSFTEEVPEPEMNLNEWIEKIIQQESSGDPQAVSLVGARGLMQIMKPTWDEWTKKLYGQILPFDKAFDPEINQQVGIAYLEWIQSTLRTWMGREPTIAHILAAYNGGIGRLRKNNYDVSKMPTESINYVTKITGENPIEKTSAHFVYAYEKMDRVKARDLYNRIVIQVGHNWNAIVHQLLREGVPSGSDIIRYINTLYLRDTSLSADKQWRYHLTK